MAQPLERFGKLLAEHTNRRRKHAKRPPEIVHIQPLSRRLKANTRRSLVAGRRMDSRMQRQQHGG